MVKYVVIDADTETYPDGVAVGVPVAWLRADPSAYTVLDSFSFDPDLHAKEPDEVLQVVADRANKAMSAVGNYSLLVYTPGSLAGAESIEEAWAQSSELYELISGGYFNPLIFGAYAGAYPAAWSAMAEGPLSYSKAALSGIWPNPRKKGSFGDSPAGSGGRFAQCVRTMRKRRGVDDPEGLCASIGRRKYGKKRFQKMAERGRRNPADWLAYEHLEQAVRQLARAYRTVNTAQRTLENVPGDEWMKFGRLADKISALYKEAWDMVPEELHWRGDRQLPGPTRTFDDFSPEAELADEIRMYGMSYADHIASKGDPDKNPGAHRVNPDGRWHKDQFGDITKGKGTAYGMATAKGEAVVVPYKPRTFQGSRYAAEIYEELKSQKVPKGSKYIVLTYTSAEGPSKASAHKSLDEAKTAGANALRRLPMPNPAARLVNEGILAGSRPIPSGLDSPRYNEGILAGSRPIPSGFDSPRVNVGIVDPPITRRTKPEQPF